MKRLLLIALLVPLPVRAACVAFLIPPKAPAWADQAGVTDWKKERTDYVRAYGAPKGSFKHGYYFRLPTLTFGSTWATCEMADLATSGNPSLDLVKLWVWREKKTVEAVWVKKSELIQVPFERTSAEGGEVLSADHAMTLALDRMKSANFKAPEIESQHTFAADFDKTWAAMIETLSDQKWQVESIDKGSGLVTTKPAVDQEGSTMVCATKLDEAHKTWLNIFVKRVEAGTRIKVNATFRAIRDDQVITCFSNGTLEKALFDAVEKGLKDQ